MIRPAEVIRSSECAPVELVAVPRPNGAVRWLARLGADGSSRYDAVVSHLTPLIERSLGPYVVATRALGRGAIRTSLPEPWRPARTRWRRALTAVLGYGPPDALLVADVAKCYASIQPGILERRLRELGAAPWEVTPLLALLERFHAGGVRGLPVGPSPSAVLANAVLSAVDEELRLAGVRHVRWVDDVVAFTSGGREAVMAFDALRRGLDRMGLEPNEAKTSVLTDERMIRDRLLVLRPSTGGASAVR